MRNKTDWEEGQAYAVERYLNTEGSEDTYEEFLETLKKTRDASPTFWRGALFGLLAEFGSDV
jgi:hypothetical protein